MDFISVTNEYLSTKEAAERLAVSAGTVRCLIKGGNMVQSMDEYIGRQKIIV